MIHSILISFFLILSSYGFVIEGLEQRQVDFPNVVMIKIYVDGAEGFCTGAFIDHQKIVTAAHCFSMIERKKNKSHLYEADFAIHYSDGSEVYTTRKFVRLDQYRVMKKDSTIDEMKELSKIDMAIILLDSDEASNSFYPIAKKFKFDPKEKYQVLGFGASLFKTDLLSNMILSLVNNTGILRSGTMYLSKKSSPFLLQTTKTYYIKNPTLREKLSILLSNENGSLQLGAGDSGGPLLNEEGELVAISVSGRRYINDEGYVRASESFFKTVTGKLFQRLMLLAHEYQ